MFKHQNIFFEGFVKNFWDAEYRILDSGCWIRDTGYWIADTRYWIAWMLDAGFMAGCLKIVIIDLNSVIYHPGIIVVLQPGILNTG